MGQLLQTDEEQSFVDHELHKLDAELNLTDQQKAKIRPILQEEFWQLKAVQEDPAQGPPGELRP